MPAGGSSSGAAPQHAPYRSPDRRTGPDSGPAPLTVVLSAEASDPEGKPLTYRWFVDGEEPQEGKMFSHVFEEVGPHLVEVVASDGELDSEPDTAEILVRDADEPEF